MSVGAQATATARIGVAGELLGVDVGWMVEQLVAATDAFADGAVLTDANVRTLTLGVTLAEDAWTPRRMARLSSGITAATVLASAAVARSGLRWLEVGSGPAGPRGIGMDGYHATLAIQGAASLDEDLAVAAALGASTQTTHALDHRLRTLALGGERRPRLLRVTVYAGDDGDTTSIELGVQVPRDVVDRLHELAEPLGISAPQLKLLARVHAILAGDAPVWIRTGGTLAGPTPGVTLTYARVSLDTCQRVVHGLSTRDDALQRLGTLVGSLGATDAELVELTAGRGDPMPARIGLVVGA